MSEELEERILEMGYTVTLTERAKEEIARAGFDPVYGARPLRRTIEMKIEDLMSEEILGNRVKAGVAYAIDFTDGKFALVEKEADEAVSVS